LGKILKKDLKIFLDSIYGKYKNKHSSKDPVWTLHDFNEAKDIEVAGLITSCYSYGQVDQINVFIRRFLKNIDFKVHEFTSNFSQQKDKKFLKGLYYRFNSEDDLASLLSNISLALNDNGSLQNLFLKNYSPKDPNIIAALSAFAKKLNGESNTGSSFRYLIPLPEKNSSCKRLNLYLRWMVRKDNIDTGIWTSVDKSKLLMPVDTHIYRISRNLGLAERKSCDMKFAIELTEVLRSFDKNDPVKYDFALCHIGIDKAMY